MFFSERLHFGVLLIIIKHYPIDYKLVIAVTRFCCGRPDACPVTVRSVVLHRHRQLHGDAASGRQPADDDDGPTAIRGGEQRPVAERGRAPGRDLLQRRSAQRHARCGARR